MLETTRTRTLLVLVLLSLQVALAPIYATQPVNPEMGVFPTEEDFIESEKKYVGEKVTTAGVVQSTEPLVVRVQTGGQSYRMVVTDGDSLADTGDTVWIFGILTGPRDIRAIDTHTVPQSGYWYSLSISFAAGLWVLFRLSRDWQFNMDTLSVQPREDGHPLKSLAVSPTRNEGEKDG